MISLLDGIATILAILVILSVPVIVWLKIKVRKRYREDLAEIKRALATNRDK